MIREAGIGDHAMIRDVNDAAFGQPDEGLLVDRLRADGDALAELVAEENGRIVGHILFSRLVLHGHDVIEAAALAPMSVISGRQRTGIGSALVTAGLARCRALSLPAVVVLGHPDYYPRFGFSAASAARLKSPFSGPAFMALGFDPAALQTERVVRYAPAFGLEDWFEEHGGTP
jgi:putative acetyltransferase